MIDAKFFTAARARIDAVTTCPDLQDAAAMLGSIAGVQGDIAARLADLQPVLALLAAPDANLAKIVTWITDYINAVLKPYVRPIELYAAQLAALAAEAAMLEAAIGAKAAAIGNCEIALQGDAE
ncbi:MAG TPA: hypothetical protein VF680_01415 [Allosphingosinicella sp.]|jgi:hypothetical protein